jgi:hypothetical protein
MDVQTFVRKSVIDFISQNDQVFFPEAFQSDPETTQPLLEAIFCGVKDDNSVKKLSLCVICALQTNSGRLDKSQNSMFNKLLKRYKFDILKLPLNEDSQISTAALKSINKMVH